MSRQRLLAILNQAGMGDRVVTFDEGAHTAAEAAAAIGCEVGAIGSSLVFMKGDEPVLIVTSGAHRVDLTRVADHLGGALKRATPDQVREATGFVIGGVSPVGFPMPVTLLVDEDLAEHDKVWVAAGHPNAVFWLTYAELLELTGGTPLQVA